MQHTGNILLHNEYLTFKVVMLLIMHTFTFLCFKCRTFTYEGVSLHCGIDTFN